MNKKITRRPEDRVAQQLRPTHFELNAQRSAAGSVIISTGHTKVLCAASIEYRRPGWMRNKEGGWVTAEYSMLPGSSPDRISRRRPNSRGTEIQRLIGRSLRSVVDLERLPEVTITVDCDVIDADGGTRTASITGAWVAFYLACQRLIKEGHIESQPIVGQVAAVSVGIVEGECLLDLDYPEDRDAQVDMNVVGSAGGGLVEVQGTAEGRPFTGDQMTTMLAFAQSGISELVDAQCAALGISRDVFADV